MKLPFSPVPGGFTRSFEYLREDIKQKAMQHIDLLEHRGIKLLVYCTFRDEWEQARLFRVNRSIQEIEHKAEDLADAGFQMLAKILMDVGPQPGEVGPKKTKAGPGESAHQHQLAYDAVPLVGGKPIWGDTSIDDKLLWDTVHETAKLVGLQTLSWERPHFQLPDFHLSKNRLIYMREKYLHV